MIIRWLSVPLLACLAAMPVEAASGVPAEVTARIAVLDRQCIAAGGKPAAQSYIFVHDYTGDGIPDYLISEGNYGCAGRNGLFVKDGTAAIEIFAARPDGRAASAYRATVLGYRLLDRTPTLVQVAKAGAAACGGQPRCGYDLVWNQTLARLEDKPVGTAPRATPPAPLPSAELEPPVAGSLHPQTEAEALADCRAEQRAAGMNAKYVAEACTEEWKKLNASLPLARTIIALMSQPLATVRTPAGLKTALPGTKWDARPERPRPPLTLNDSGTMGRLQIGFSGKGAIDSLVFSWGETGALIPYALPAALRFLGVKLTLVACGRGGDAYGDGTTRSFRVEQPGAAPFGLDVAERIAAIGSQQSFWSATIALGQPAPSFARLRAAQRSRDPIEETQWSQTCQP
ncbi:hypothetical protein [Sphingomonas sp.]|uniref:hypothetical protein n=1 Tax=Sphingomonas sp. TaxID=28214 RepID=UPI0025CBB489|nr:hypothetical protein [Sphingomonas sp.]